MAGLTTVTGGGIKDGAITNADINASASIDASKVSGLSTDSITEGNTTVECVDTGSNGHITFDTENTERMRILADGKVGINTTTPASPFNALGTGAVPIRFESTSSAECRIGLKGTTGENTYNVGVGSSGENLGFWTNNTQRVTVLDNGDVGIATTSPTANLHIAGGNAKPAIYLHGSNKDIGYNSILQFGEWDGSTYTERMRIDANGRLGIGTTNPPYDLSVHSGGTTEIDLYSSQSNGHSYIYMRGDGTTPAQIIYFGDAANQWAGNITYTHTDDTLKLQAYEDIKLKPNNGNSGLDVLADGPVKLYHNNSIKVETVTRGLTTHGEYRVGAPGTSEKVIASALNLTTIYLSNSGDDANDGLSSANAVRSLTRAWALTPKVCFPGQSVIYSFDADYEFENGYTKVFTGWAHGDYYYGPHIRFQGSGAQRTITMNASIGFRNCAGIRFENLKFVFSGNTGQNITFQDCKMCKFYSSCAFESSSTAGWSALLQFNNCTDMKLESNITLTSTASAGLGGAMVVNNSELYFYGTLSKTGTLFGNTGISIINGSWFTGTFTVNNFATGLFFGTNHYNAETGARGLLNSVTISNCTTGIKLRNFSYPRKYNVTYSGNTTNENIYTNGGAFT